MVGLVLSINLGLSVVEIVGSCHSRQKSGDFVRLSVARGLFVLAGVVRDFFCKFCVCVCATLLIEKRKYGRGM